MASGRSFDLTDLLTAAGVSMAAANSRLTAANAPALMRQFDLSLNFPGSVKLQATGLCVLRPNGGADQPSTGSQGSTVSITATYIAAPSLIPVPPLGGVVDP